MDEKDYKEALRELKGLSARINELLESLDIPSRKIELAELEKETVKDDFWQNKERFASINQQISSLKRKIEPWDRLVSEINESIELLQIAFDDKDYAIISDIVSKTPLFDKKFGELETIELLSEDEDENNVFLTIHPGAGGTESQDWANMLFRMYYRWSEKKGYSIDVIDYTPGEEAGIKSATMLIKGQYAYGFLKGEKGIHRLVRISPFDSNKRRHTSFASVEAMPEISEEIEVEVRESDLKIDTYRASGAGGQHVNKTDSAVRITHLPTGIVVQCQNERSQHKNKAFAMKVLKSKIYEMEKKKQEDKKLEKAGVKKDISWGNQIRSYVFQPYTLVKDHRTGEEIGNIEAVFDGDIDKLIYSLLKSLKTGT